MAYKISSKNNSKLRLVIIILTVLLVLASTMAIGARLWYQNQLEPVSDVQKIVTVEIPEGSSAIEIANILKQKDVIKNSQAFQWYIRTNSLTNAMKAGTYELDASKPTPSIVEYLTEGNIKEVLFTIKPESTLQKISSDLVNYGFQQSEVDEALKAESYQNHPALVAKPSKQSLEGYLYPESFKTTSSTTAKQIIEQSLDEMADAVTPELIDAWQKQGLGIHQAITLASIVENEVSTAQDRAMVAGVFYNRLATGMRLESDPTYRYGGKLLGVDGSSSLDSPYNTYKIDGLPPGPISNVSKSSLEAVAYPKKHEFLFFVAGDDGVTRFSKTLEEHQANTAKYCIDLCKSY